MTYVVSVTVKVTGNPRKMLTINTERNDNTCVCCLLALSMVGRFVPLPLATPLFWGILILARG